MDIDFVALVIVAGTLLGIPPAIAYAKGRPVGFVILGMILFYPAALIGAIIMDRDEAALAERRAKPRP